MTAPKIKDVDFGGNCGLGVCFLHLSYFWFYVYFSLVFIVCLQLWIWLLVCLLSSFVFLLFQFFLFLWVHTFMFLCVTLFSFAFTICLEDLSVYFCVCVCVCVSVCVYVFVSDFVCLVLLLTFVLGFCLFIFFSTFSSVPCGCQGLDPLAECWAWASKVKELTPGCWTTRDLRPHVILIGERSPRDILLNTKTQFHQTTTKWQCWVPHDKQLTRQEHNPTH